jgi:hypothetical protein
LPGPPNTITEFRLAPSTSPVRIIAGPDGNLWFTEINGGKIGRLGLKNSFTLTRVRLRANNALAGGGDNGTIRVQGKLDASMALGAALRGGVSVSVTVSGAGLAVPETILFPMARCLALSAGSIRCIGDRAATATFRQQGTQDVFAVSIRAPLRSFPAPLSATGVSVNLSFDVQELSNQLGICTVRSHGLIADCRGVRWKLTAGRHAWAAVGPESVHGQ